MKKFGGFHVFVGDVICYKWGRFRTILPRSSGSGSQLQEGSISVKCLVVSRLKFESFEHLIGFLAFLVQKLWPKKQYQVKIT